MSAYSELKGQLETKGLNVDTIKKTLKAQHIETPSWGYGPSGTRFKTFPHPGTARNIYEKLDDASVVNKLTGVAPSVAMHIPWDKTKDYKALKKYAKDKGLSLGAINPNLFQDENYKLGSSGNPSKKIRQQATDHMLECVDIMKQTGSRDLSLWFADGTNYPGQDDIRRRKRDFYASLETVYKTMNDNMRMLIEYKFYEPAFYHTDLPDWGVAYSFANKLGKNAYVLVDMGHHAQGVNIEHIVTFLIDENKMGGFHFNNRKYGDDDLMVGSINPFELFAVYSEIVKCEQSSDKVLRASAKGIAYMLDQCHNIEGKMGAIIQSVINCQIAYAKALCVNYKELAKLQAVGEVLAAHNMLLDGFHTDVRPLLAEIRKEMRLHPDPLQALKESGYEAKIAKERGTMDGGSGFPT
jgi:L-rhamnose isomerase / sugar isomerase